MRIFIIIIIFFFKKMNYKSDVITYRDVAKPEKEKIFQESLLDYVEKRKLKIKNLMEMDNKNFEIIVLKERDLVLVRESLDSDVEFENKFGLRAAVLLWDFIINMNDLNERDEILDAIYDACNVWVDCDDVDMEDNVLDLRDFLKEEFDKVFSESDGD